MNAVSLVALDEAAKRPDRAIGYQEFLPASRCAPQPPAFLFGTLPAYLTPDLFSEYTLGSVGCYRIKTARVTSDGVVLRNGEAFWSLAWNHPDSLVAGLVDPAGANRCALPVRRMAGQVTIIHGPATKSSGTGWSTCCRACSFCNAAVSTSVACTSCCRPIRRSSVSTSCA